MNIPQKNLLVLQWFATHPCGDTALTRDYIAYSPELKNPNGALTQYALR